MVLRPGGTPEYRRSCVEAEGPPLQIQSGGYATDTCRFFG